MMAAETKSIVLIGATGTGKSSLGNGLLGYPVVCNSRKGFRMSRDTEGCTVYTKAIDGYLLGDRSRPIRVIDTPGASDDSKDNQELREYLTQGLRNEKVVHAFVLVKNFTAPRFVEQDKTFFEIFREMFGKGFVQNLIIIFTRYSHSAKDECARRKQGLSLERIIAGVRHELGGDRCPVPMLAIDAHFDDEDPTETTHFKNACGQLWNHIVKLSVLPVEHVQAVKDKMAKLVEETQRLTVHMKEMEHKHKQEVEKVIEKMQQERREYERQVQTLRAEQIRQRAEFERRQREASQQFETQIDHMKRMHATGLEELIERKVKRQTEDQERARSREIQEINRQHREQIRRMEEQRHAEVVNKRRELERKPNKYPDWAEGMSLLTEGAVDVVEGVGGGLAGVGKAVGVVTNNPLSCFFK